MPAVVIMATVEAPIASFRIMAMINGIRIPIPVFTSPPTESAIGSSFKMAPKEPPAPVIARIAAESVTPWVTHFSVFSFSLDGIRLVARNTPKIRATSGLPIKVIRVKKKPVPKGLPGKLATEARAMRIIGSKIGEKLWSAPGSLPYLACSSS